MLDPVVPVLLALAGGALLAHGLTSRIERRRAKEREAQLLLGQEKRVKEIHYIAGEGLKPAMDASVIENTGRRFEQLDNRMARFEVKLEDHFGRAIGDRLLAGKDRARIIELEDERRKEGVILREALSNQGGLIERLVALWDPPKKGEGGA